jgi:hypothetical protein
LISEKCGVGEARGQYRKKIAARKMKYVEEERSNYQNTSLNDRVRLEARHREKGRLRRNFLA